MVSAVAFGRILKLKNYYYCIKKKDGLDGLDFESKPKSESREPKSESKSKSRELESKSKSESSVLESKSESKSKIIKQVQYLALKA